MHRRDAGKTELKFQAYHCNKCGAESTVQFQSDGVRVPPNSVACIRCKEPVRLNPNNWTTRTSTARHTQQPPNRTASV